MGVLKVVWGNEEGVRESQKKKPKQQQQQKKSKPKKTQTGQLFVTQNQATFLFRILHCQMKRS